MPEITTSDALRELVRELNEILYSRGASLHLQHEREVRWSVVFRGVPYGSLYRVESVTGDKHVAEEERHAAPAVEDDETPGGAKARGVSDALDALYPDDIIKVTALERDNTVRQWLIDNKRSVPVDLGKAVRRELAKRSEEKSHEAGPRR